MLKYPHSLTRDGMKLLREEADRYICLGPHENLVAFEAFTEEGLLLEYCQQGELQDMIDFLTNDQKLAIVKQIAQGLIHLHT